MKQRQLVLSSEGSKYEMLWEARMLYDGVEMYETWWKVM
jgi:hypothetical protein